MKSQDELKERLVDYQKVRFEIRKIMRYEDVGDYFDNTIVAYDMGDPIVNNAIFIHEFIEFTLIKSAGITPALIDKFDTDDDAPDQYPQEYKLYRKYHRLANKIERQFIENLGYDWKSHEKRIDTAKIQTAVEHVTDQLHKDQPSEKRIEKSKVAIAEVWEEN